MFEGMNKKELSGKITGMKKVTSGKGDGRELKGFFLIFEEENEIKWELNHKTQLNWQHKSDKPIVTILKIWSYRSFEFIKF
jgi:hypothetical protein